MSEANQFDVLFDDEELRQLLGKINRGHRKVVGVRRKLPTAQKVGAWLAQAKEQVKAKVGHGHWGHWIKENCDFGKRTDQVYRQLYKQRDRLAELLKAQNSAELPHLDSIDQALKLLREGIQADKEKDRQEEEKEKEEEEEAENKVDDELPDDEPTPDDQVKREEEREFEDILSKAHSSVERMLSIFQKIERDFNPSVWSKDHPILVEIRKKCVDLEALCDRVLRRERGPASS